MALSTNLHEPRVLPVIVLADVSGSMAEHAKIETLNLAIREMLGALANSAEPDVEVRVAVIAFGGSSARLHAPLAAPDPLGWTDLIAAGGTPLGAALDELVKLTDDRSVLPVNSFVPTVLLVSDGHPTDNFDAALTRFGKASAGTRSVRLALRIGPDANEEVLERFTGDAGAVLTAADAADIDKHFQFVTYTVMSRAKSTAQGTTDMPTLRQFGTTSGPLF
jgi:uncharacterized protein YegL